MTALAIYLTIFIAIGFWESRRNYSFFDFTLAGRSKGSYLVMMSILATAIGASSTMGVSGLAHKVGFPAFWWLGVGVIGLLLQALFLTRRVRSLEAFTLPDVALKTIGSNARILVSIVIVIAWIGIIAAQFVAAAKVMSSMAPEFSFEMHLIIGASIMMAYALLGGQNAVIRTDSLQFGILISAIVVTIYYLFGAGPAAKEPITFELLNSSFGSFNFFYFLLIVGGSYFVGPDMFSRVLTSQSEKSAQKAVFMSAFVLLIMSVGITMVGLWTRSQGIDLGSNNPLTYVIQSQLPNWAALLLSFGLLSAIISSADTCLITVSSIVEYDIFKQTRIGMQRIFLLMVGLLAMIIALWWRDIIRLLISAYSIYSAGIVPPLVVALLCYGRRKLSQGLMSLAIVSGGILGVIATFSGHKYLALVGLGASAVLSCSAFLFNGEAKND